MFDGVSGKPVSGRPPGDQTYQAIAAGLGSADAAFPDSEYELFGLAGFVVGLVLALAGYWVFLFGSEVTEGKLTGGISFSMKGFGLFSGMFCIIFHFCGAGTILPLRYDTLPFLHPVIKYTFR